MEDGLLEAARPARGVPARRPAQGRNPRDRRPALHACRGHRLPRGSRAGDRGHRRGRKPRLSAADPDWHEIVNARVGEIPVAVTFCPLCNTALAFDRRVAKERVIYVEVGKQAFAVPFSTLAKKRIVVVDTDEGQVIVRWRPGVASALDSGAIAEGRDVGSTTVVLEGEPVPFSEPFWFAVAAFRPDIDIVD